MTRSDPATLGVEEMDTCFCCAIMQINVRFWTHEAVLPFNVRCECLQ